jgi:hypothetical protein
MQCKTDKSRRCIPKVATLVTVVIVLTLAGVTYLNTNASLVQATTEWTSVLKRATINQVDVAVTSNHTTKDESSILTYREEGNGVPAGKISVATSAGNRDRQSIALMRQYNFTKIEIVLDRAQIPPPHAPWITRSSASIEQHQDLLSNLEQRINEVLRYHGNTLATTERETQTRPLPAQPEHLYMIWNGTLWALEGDSGGRRKKPMEQMIQSALDLAQVILQLKDRGALSQVNSHDAHLMRALILDSTATIPLIASAADFKKCQPVPVEEGDTLSNRSDKGYPLMSWTTTQYPTPESPFCIPFGVPCYKMWDRLRQYRRYVPVKDKGKNAQTNQSDNTHAVPPESADSKQNMRRLDLTASAKESREKSDNITQALSSFDKDTQPNKAGTPKQASTTVGHTNWLTMSSNELNATYPWESKIPKVVWRGSTTGGSPYDLTDDENGATAINWRDMPRSKLIKIARNHPDIMDMGFTELNQGWEELPYKDQIVEELGQLPQILLFEDFMKYKAILDINGNSWSMRFGHLLCLNSVVMKVSEFASIIITMHLILMSRNVKLRPRLYAYVLKLPTLLSLFSICS